MEVKWRAYVGTTSFYKSLMNFIFAYINELNKNTVKVKKFSCKYCFDVVEYAGK